MELSLPANAFPNPTQHRIIERLVRAANSASSAIGELSQPGEPLVIPKAEQVWREPITVEFPDDKDYLLSCFEPFAWSIDGVATLATSGSCTVTISIDGTPLGGGPSAAGTTLATVEHTSANAVAVGSQIMLTISGNSSCEGLNIVLIGRRTLDTL